MQTGIYSLSSTSSINLKRLFSICEKLKSQLSDKEDESDVSVLLGCIGISLVIAPISLGIVLGAVMSSQGPIAVIQEFFSYPCCAIPSIIIIIISLYFFSKVKTRSISG